MSVICGALEKSTRKGMSDQKHSQNALLLVNRCRFRPRFSKSSRHFWVQSAEAVTRWEWTKFRNSSFIKNTSLLDGKLPCIQMTEVETINRKAQRRKMECIFEILFKVKSIPAAWQSSSLRLWNYKNCSEIVKFLIGRRIWRPPFLAKWSFCEKWWTLPELKFNCGKHQSRIGE